ncbi:unnamed protein product [Auanema sp. JU1783]|nr:unnamed protein product [Auanema sp. JU1783]
MGLIFDKSLIVFLLYFLIELQVATCCFPCDEVFSLKDSRRRKIGSDFDYLMLTRIYPVAVCQADDDAVADSCEIPVHTPSWTVHGLWPNFQNGSYPQFCHGSPPTFDINLVDPILHELSTNWPNLLTHHSVESLWKHEYDKHGTCSQSDSKLETELKYFNATLALNELYDVDHALHLADIQPSLYPYRKTAIQEALNKYLGKGKHVQFNCLKDRKSGKTMLGDVRMCIDKDFAIVDCPKEYSPRSISRGAPLPAFHKCPEDITYLLPQKTHLKSSILIRRSASVFLPPKYSCYAFAYDRGHMFVHILYDYKSPVLR